MVNPHASPRARAASVESLETISVHYSPAEDPYWTELMAHHARAQDSDSNDGNRVDENENENRIEDETENEDADSELLPFLLDDLIQGQDEGHEVVGERRPWLRWPDPDTVHREAEGLVREFRRLSTGREPGDSSAGIDVSILQKYRRGRGGADTDTEEPPMADDDKKNDYQSPSEDRVEHDHHEPESRNSARAQLLRDSEAITKLLHHQSNRHGSDNTCPPPHPDPLPIHWQTALLHTLPPSPPPRHPPAPRILSDPLLTALWVRQQIQGRWTHKYHATLATERADLKARSHRAKLAHDTAEQRAVASAKRKLHRTVVADCMRDALVEIDSALRSRLREPLADIDATAADWKALQCLAVREHVTLAEGCGVVQQREAVMAATVADVLPDLEDRLGAVERLLGVAEEEMRKMRTRYARVCALDVRGGGGGGGGDGDGDGSGEREREREAEMERRLGRPEALVYLLKGWEDVRMVREVAWGVVERFEDVESGLGDLVRAGMEYGMAVEGAWLLGEVEGLGL